MGVGARFARRHLPHLIVTAVALIALLGPEGAIGTVQSASTIFLNLFNGATLAIALGAVVICAVIACSPLGSRRLGGAGAQPEFRLLTWFAMLFAAGMGTGLVFWGAAEPLIHWVTPPPGGAASMSDAARRDSLAITQFHWAIHAWAIYALAGLVVGVAMRDAATPPMPSAPFAKLPLGWRRIIDWGAVIAVVFGIVATLGQGAFQMSAGVGRLSQGAIADSVLLQAVIMVILTVAYLSSAVVGLRRGIAVLSNINLVMAGGLALFVLIAGPTSAILQTAWDSLTAYLVQFWALSTTLRPEGEARAWTHGWSITYLLWWVAWTPFVGAFIARISYGRRLRTFVAGVVLIPSIVTLVWFSIFGGAAIHFQSSGVDFGITDFENAPKAIFLLLESLPITAITQTLAVALVFIFLLTSADSGAYVLAMITSQKAVPPVAERLFWGGTLAVIAISVILSADGQEATRAFAVSGAIPMIALLTAQTLALVGYFRTSKPKAET